jgi:hypothetical protein
MVPYEKKDLYLKMLWLSVIGAVVIAIIFWIITDIFGLFKGGDQIVAFTNGIIYAGVVGNMAGTALVVWRVSDKYYPKKMPGLLKRYGWLSLLNILVVIGLLQTPAGLITAIWSLVPPAYAVMLFSRAGLFDPKKVKRPKS